MAEPATTSAAPSRPPKRRRADEFDGEDDAEDSTRQPAAKKVRFPKGKKAKEVEDVPAEEDEDEYFVPAGLVDPRHAASQRVMRRRGIEGDGGISLDVSAAEINYENGGNFENDGILMEPFNLKHEREEGYFDANGNFVAYIGEKETKDAWLDSVGADITYIATNAEDNDEEEEIKELSSSDIGQMKRRIANVLEPGETVLRALRRLKGNSDDRKIKMSEATKRSFDQLTEDAMKLLESGDYNVYHEEKEVFVREAEGYERLARIKGIPVFSGEDGFQAMSSGDDIHADADADADAAAQRSNSSIFDIPLPAPSSLSFYTELTPSTNDDDADDMFADEDGKTETKTYLEGTKSSDGKSEQIDSDYVYDDSSGYYYSSSLGYYYDPASGLYCSAASGLWYAYNEQSGTYDEVKAESETATA